MPLPVRALALASALAGSSLVAAPALAHIDLLAPAARASGRPDTTLSRGPCGQRENARREQGAHVFRPGQSIDLVLDVYVQHVSYFRIAFDADGDDSFSDRPSLPRDPAADDPSLLPAGEGELILDYIQDRTGDVERIERRITLPDVECERCTLQVIQFTYGLPLARATYYQCADLVLDASAPGGDAEQPEGETDAPGGAGVGASDAGGADGDVAASEKAGCSLSQAGVRPQPAASALLCSLAAALVLARRRSTRRAHGAGSDSIHSRNSAT